MTLQISLTQKQAVAAILSPDDPTNLLVFGYKPGSTSILDTVEKSDQHVERFLELAKPDVILYALVGFDVNGQKRVIFIGWCGPKTARNLAAKFPTDSSDIARFAFKAAHGKITTTDLGAITPAKVRAIAESSVGGAGPARHGRPLTRRQTAPASTDHTDASVETKEQAIQRRRQEVAEQKALAAEEKKQKLQAEIAVAQDELKAKLQAKAESFKDVNKKLSLKQISEAISLFEECDVDGNGVLDMQEFMMLKDTLAPRISRDLWTRLAKNYFEKADADHSGGIDIREFLGTYTDMFCLERRQTALMIAQNCPDTGLSLEEIERGLQLFEKYDLDRNGCIDVDEFYQLKEQIFGPEVSKLVIRYATETDFAKMDADRSGEISETEFLKLMDSMLRKPEIELNPVKEDVLSKFNTFARCETLEGCVLLFNELKEMLAVGPGDDVYTKVRNATYTDTRAKLLWSLLDAERAHAEYKAPWVAKKAKVLVVGAGPAGLRAAIDYAMLGAPVELIEMKRTFSRHNLLHLWDSTIRELKNLGAKYFFGQFCSGGINHVSIRDLQLMLLKIALLNGVQVYTKVAFKGIKENLSKHPATGKTLWHADVTSTLLPEGKEFTFNVLVGADGAHSSIISNYGFDVKVLQGGEAIGITCNFKNTKTKAESHLREFGLLSVYEQQFFKDLKDKHQVDLENLVYYRGETHYLVMTAKRASLLQRGVMKLNHPDVKDFLKRDNIDPRQLEAYCRSVADYIHLPAGCEFAVNARNTHDVAIFDFSAKRQSSEPLRFLDWPGTNDKLLVFAVGDAVIEPFWPLGTGANRAVLGAADSAWTIRSFFSDDAPSNEQIKEEAQGWYKILMCSSQDDLQPNFSLHTLNPSTRYKKGSTTAFH